MTTSTYTANELAVSKHLRKLWIRNERANEPFIRQTIQDIPRTELPEGAAVVIGAGYGVEEQVPMLEGRKVTTFCTDKARPVFAKHGMVPDYTLALNTEKTEEVELSQWFKDVGTGDHLIMPVTAHYSHMRVWKGGPVSWMVPQNIDSDLALKWAKKYDLDPYHRGANCGEFAYQMACYLRKSPIALIGMPYAWKSLPEVLRDQGSDNYEYHHFCADGKHCFTTLGFMQQRTEFLEVVEMHSKVWDGDVLVPWIKTYNCSEGGILYSDTLERSTLEEFLERFA